MIVSHNFFYWRFGSTLDDTIYALVLFHSKESSRLLTNPHIYGIAGCENNTNALIVLLEVEPNRE